MKTLLLNSTYEPISFIPWKKVIKLVLRGKVDILSHWNDSIRHGNGAIKRPSIIRLKYYVPRHIKRRRYNRSAVFKRDGHNCQYCGQTKRVSELTIDHVLPKSHGGKTVWENCVACCFACNNKKANRTPKQAKMVLIRKPLIPRMTVWHEYVLMSNTHEDWQHYIIER